MLSHKQLMMPSLMCTFGIIVAVTLAGCMLCFGQSAFFRFNHPEEALRMKSLLPGGLSHTGTQPAGKSTFPFCFSAYEDLAQLQLDIV